MNTLSNLSLLTDFYELTMMQGYFFKAPECKGVFEMFYRQHPFGGGYTIFAGLAPLLDVIEKIKFTDEDLSYLASLNIFKDKFLEYLSTFSFKGSIYSLREGSVISPNEPLLSVYGSLMEAQLIESMVLNYLNFQSLIATKTARIVDIAGSTPVLEFGLRRAQGINGAISATRAAYIGGASSTSNTLGAKLFNIPVSGTMAHSWVMSFESELDSFKEYADLYPDKSVLLVDTYDTLESGVPNAIRIFRELKKTEPALMAIRLDSGDLEYLSKKSRDMLDIEGLQDVKIFVSNEIDEWIIEQLKNSNSPIDAWGVGTRLVTGGNDPALTGVYKIVAKGNGETLEPCMKISNESEKMTVPGIKNIMRFYNKKNRILADLLYLKAEENDLQNKIANMKGIYFNHSIKDDAGFLFKDYSHARILLNEVMRNGEKIDDLPTLHESREYRQREIDSLEKKFKLLRNPQVYKIGLSDNLKKLKADLIKKSV